VFWNLVWHTAPLGLQQLLPHFRLEPTGGEEEEEEEEEGLGMDGDGGVPHFQLDSCGESGGTAPVSDAAYASRSRLKYDLGEFYL